MIENPACELASIPAYYNSIIIDTMVIIMYNIHYINIYYKLKFGLFLDSSLTATR